MGALSLPDCAASGRPRTLHTHSLATLQISDEQEPEDSKLRSHVLHDLVSQVLDYTRVLGTFETEVRGVQGCLWPWCVA